MNESTSVKDYITLGDGDFTYSYDLCRFLQAQASISASSIHSASKQQQSKVISIVCSGIDPLTELQNKYKDADFLMKKIDSLNEVAPSLWRSKHEDGHGHVSKRQRANANPDEKTTIDLKISLHHSVNAIMPWSSEDNETNCTLQPTPSLPQCTFNHVIFNHPHIGNEDAQLHSRFLSHFFHSVDNHWLAPSGILHLTLVKGQFERWKCKEAAERNQLEVVHRDIFKPPPSPGEYVQFMLKEVGVHGDESNNIMTFQAKDDFKCRYQYRRHQTGKSFANRAKGGSETISFRRKSGLQCDTLLHLPWQNLDFRKDDNTLCCPHCSKYFCNERARKNHIKCVHNGSGEGDNNKSIIALFCEICGEQRTFPNHDALQAHTKAKHSGSHTDIKPEWSAAVSGNTSTAITSKLQNDNQGLGSASDCCTICGFEFENRGQKLKHFYEFIPQFSTTENADKELLLFACFNCNKSFKNMRAQKQHENFCCV